MKLSEYRVHDAALAAAKKLTPKERSNLIAARAARDEARQAWDQAGGAWAAAEAAKYEWGHRGEAAARRRDDLLVARDLARDACEVAMRSLSSFEWDLQANRAIRVRAVEIRWQALVDERSRQASLPKIGQMTRVRVFESPEEREAAYAAERAR